MSEKSDQTAGQKKQCMSEKAGQFRKNQSEKTCSLSEKAGRKNQRWNLEE
jgi:hypothetical protein